MGTILSNTKSVTPQEYLSWEVTQEGRHEYLNGTVRAMSGGSIEHNQIVTNLVTAVASRLLGSGCRSFTSSQRVQANSGRYYFYPDVGIYCGSPQRGEQDSIVNVVALFEVLSPSTERYDRFEKYRRYLEIESLQEYFLVHQDSPLVEVYRRMPGESWSVCAYSLMLGIETSCSIEGVGLVIPLSEIYEGLEFEGVATTPE